MHALHRAELTTDTAGDVTGAKRLLARGSYTVLVLDLILPDGTGFDVLDSIKSASAAPLQVIVITTADSSTLGRIDRSLAKTVMFKPIDVEQFVASVRALATVQPRRVACRQPRASCAAAPIIWPFLSAILIGAILVTLTFRGLLLLQA